MNRIERIGMHKRNRRQYTIDGAAYGANMKKRACAALAICLLACSKNNEVGTASFAEMVAPVQAVSITRKLEFGFNAEQFVDAFNAAAVVAGDPDAIDHSAVLAISEAIAEATNPDLSRSKGSALASDMMQEAGGNHDAGKFPQRFINNVRYVLRSDSDIGYWWMANPA